jgi:hypothetical protein
LGHFGGKSKKKIFKQEFWQISKLIRQKISVFEAFHAPHVKNARKSSFIPFLSINFGPFWREIKKKFF